MAARSERGPPCSTSVSSGADSTSTGWVGASETRSADGIRQRIVRPARCPPPFLAFAVDQGTDHLSPRGDIGKRRQIDPKRQGLAALPALLLIDQKNVEPVRVGNVGMRRQKSEHVRGRNAALPELGKALRQPFDCVRAGVRIHRRIDPRRPDDESSAKRQEKLG